MVVAAALTGFGLTSPACAGERASDPPAAIASQSHKAHRADDRHEGEEADEIIVQGTRVRRRVQDEPIRVDVLVREEIEEKLLMRPGNIAMLLNETPGIRLQVTSPALGAANIRIRGMEGRYTLLLADGLPLFGGQPSSLGALQIPPTDLAQVEVIKGAASALYGPSALGGVINLISRTPGNSVEAELLGNVTTRDGQDLTGYAATPLGGGWSASLTAGAHRQSRQDLDGDGWIDMPFYQRWTARPRLFWADDYGASLMLTVGVVTEERVGGTLARRTTPDGNPFPQTQDTNRIDLGLVAEMPLVGIGVLALRGSAMQQEDSHRFGTVLEEDRHRTGFAEASLSGGTGQTTWVGGAAFQIDDYRSETFPDFDYRFTVPALFAQVEQELGEAVTLAASARLDFHSDYGTQFSPRLSALYRAGAWSVRATAGRGFFAPTPFIEEIEAAGLSQLEPLGRLKAETARNASLDVGYASGPFEANLAVFASDIDKAVRLVPIAADRVRMVNANGATRIRGAELLLRYRWDAVSLTGSYVHLDATEPDDNGTSRQRLPLTPRHAAGMVAMWEEHDRGRIGFEAYYTGRQSLDDNPFRTTSRPYVHMGLLGEIVLGRVRLFLNAENLLNVRQTRWDPLVRPARAPDGRWTVDAWAPTDGLVLKGGVRLKLGAE
jgi:iron complex outermembrane receptor protein